MVRPCTVALLAMVAGATGCGAGSPGTAQRTTTATIEIRPPSGAEEVRGPAAAPRPSVPGGESCDGAHEPTTPENLRQAEIAVRCLTNAARREQGLDELRFDERLARAAATRSNDMAEANFFGHQGPGNSNVRTAVSRTGWTPENESWLLGENIGWAGGKGATPARLMRSWLNSRSHRENLFAPHFETTGVGAVAAVPRRDAKAGATFTQVFGVTGEGARRAQR